MEEELFKLIVVCILAFITTGSFIYAYYLLYNFWYTPKYKGKEVIVLDVNGDKDIIAIIREQRRNKKKIKRQNAKRRLEDEI